MPTTRRKAAEPVQDQQDAMPLDVLPASSQEPDDEESVLDRLRSLGGDDRDRMRIKVYRKTVHGQLEWCTDYTVAEWEEGDVSRVRADWGSGTYEMRVVIGGRPGIRYREVFRIAADAKPIMQNPAPAAPQASELAEVVRMLAEGQQRILEAVSQRPDPTAQLQSTLGLMAAMREAMGLNQAPPPAPAASDPGAMLGQLVGAIRQLREVATEVNPPASDPDNPMAMLGQVVDIVKLGMAQRQAEPMPGVQLPAALQAEPVQNPAAPTQEADMGILVLRGQLQQLCDMAARGEPPEKGGEFVADELPDELLGYLELPNIVQILSTFNREVLRHESWFLAARTHALKLLAEEPDQAQADPVQNLSAGGSR
jgi:hypothetical protein